MRPRGRVLLPGVVALVAAWAVVETAGWPVKTALYPRVVGIPLLVLATAETLLGLRGREETDRGGAAMDFALSEEVPPRVALRRTVAIIAWMGAFYLSVILFGFPWAIPLFVCAYLKGQVREAWLISLALPAIGWLGFYLLFVRLLHTPFAVGLLWQFFFR